MCGFNTRPICGYFKGKQINQNHTSDIYKYIQDQKYLHRDKEQILFFGLTCFGTQSSSQQRPGDCALLAHSSIHTGYNLVNLI